MLPRCGYRGGRRLRPARLCAVAVRCRRQEMPDNSQPKEPHEEHVMSVATAPRVSLPVIIALLVIAGGCALAQDAIGS